MQGKMIRLGLAAALCLVAGATVPARADLTIDVTPSVAPNAFGSPSYGAYVQNAVDALATGTSSWGDPNSPSYYQALSKGSTVSADQVLVSGFPSWLGTADPGTAFGPNYANELGNRLLFGLNIQGNGEKFSISQLSFTEKSSDPANALGFTFGAGSYNYSNDYVGVIFGTGGNPDQYITSGANTQMVDAVFGRGSGNAFAVYMTDPGATMQDKLDNALAGIPDMTFTGTYTLGGATGSAFVNVAAAAVPEPSTLLLSGTGAVLGLAYAWRRRRRVTE
jgi:hypothetical protein